MIKKRQINQMKIMIQKQWFSDHTNILMWSILLVITGLSVLFTGLFRDKKHN